MAYQPPYGYGGGNYPPYGGSGGGYGYGGSSNNREAMLRALAQPDNPNYSYPSGGQLKNVGTQTGKGSAIAGTAADLGASVIAPQIAKSLGAGGLKGAFAQSGGLLGGTPQVGLSGAAGMGIGIGAELLGSYLKPKGQAATESPFPELTDQYKRRMEGSGEGIAGGAIKWGGRGAQIGSVVPGIGTAIGAGIGALGGAIGGAFTKNAKSAYSDFRTQDAVEAIKKMYQEHGGRLPTEQDIQAILIGQGMDANSARTHTGVVGEKGLYSILSSLDKNFAKERSAMVDQALGGGGAPGAPAAPAPVAQPLGAGGAAPGPTGQGGSGIYRGPDGYLHQRDGSPIPDTGPGGIAGPGRGGAGGVTPGPSSTQAPAAPAQPGAPQAPPAAPAAPTLPANADTDGYAAPAYTAAAASSAPPPGWDSKKWSDPAHQTPKYVVGRIMSQFAPTTENMPAVLAEIQKAYPGTTMIGKDTINIPGVGKTDVLRGADVGGKGWQWLGEHAQQVGAKGGGTGGGGTGAGYDASGDIAGGSTIAQIMAQLNAMAGGQPGGAGVMSTRDALLKQLQAG